MASCADPSKLVCALWLCALPLVVHAQSSAPAEANAPTESTTAPVGGAQSARVNVLFLLPHDQDALQADLRDALLAQFTLINAALVFVLEPEGEHSLATRVQQAQALAKENAAIAVFWIETEPDGRWFLHMMDAADERVIVRQVDASGERRPAAIEAVAVMTRSSTRALIEGTPEAPPSPAPAPQPTAPPAQPAPEMLDAFRLWLGYTGSAVAPQVPWQHGAQIGASWLGPRPFYAGLSLILTPTIKLSGEPATFSVQRIPFSGQFGYRLQAGRVALDGELGVAVERWYRPVSEPQAPAHETVDAQPASTHWLWELAPRLRGELRIASILGLYADGGLDILLNHFNYISRGENGRILLSPNVFRLVAELGVSFYP
jgi:hypothetical protein